MAAGVVLGLILAFFAILFICGFVFVVGIPVAIFLRGIYEVSRRKR